MKTLIIVDDNPVNLQMTKDALKEYYKTIAVTSANDMFKLLEKFIPDLILLDVVMPDMDGFTVMEMIKTDDRFKAIPIIFLTGKNDSASEIKCFELGAHDFISKPFTLPVLLKRIEIQIERNSFLQTIQNKNEEIMNISVQKDNILGMISHDLKNYIGTIQQAIEVMNAKYNSFESNRYITMISTSAEKALSLVKDILILNKIEAESNNIILTPHNINKYISEHSLNLVLSAKQKGIFMHFDLAYEPIICNINPDKLQRAIDNLCLNAIKFTHPEGTITIKTQKVDNCAQIHIIDTGVGIEANKIDKLFTRYSAISSTGTAGEASTGLGLYIVKQVIDQHNGSIEVKSTIGQGTEFIIKLPIIERQI